MTLYYYNQNDYANVPYNKPNGEKKDIAQSGCGVCCACMVFNTYVQKQLYSVAQMAKFSIAHGARTQNNGTNEKTLLKALCAENKGFSFTTSNSINDLKKHLEKGGLAICNQGEAYNVFSTAGHYVVAYGLENGNIKVADPDNSKTKYDLFNRPKRIVKKTAYGCVVKPAEMKKATTDRNPAYYLINYKGAEKKNEFPHPVQWKNGNTPEKMYADNNFKTVVETAAKKAKFNCYSKAGDAWLIVATRDGGKHATAGFVEYNGGLKSAPPESKAWKNGSTSETVWADVDRTKKVGSIGAYETAYCLAKIDGMYLVLYKLKDGTQKCGFVSYNGGIQ